MFRCTDFWLEAVKMTMLCWKETRLLISGRSPLSHHGSYSFLSSPGLTDG
jgi:hypothetical protein